MLIKKPLLLLIIACLSVTKSFCQQDDFCNAITAIIRDAPNKFRNIRGKLIEANANATLWAAGIKVPGTIGSRFVYAMGLFYEGAVLQTQRKEDLQPVYDKYKSLLGSCLIPQGYKLTLNDNFYPGLSSYKKVVFMLEEKAGQMAAIKDTAKIPTAPAHITMEATYNKDVGKYTVVLYIFEH